MKNKLLVFAFAVGLAAFCLTSCETKSDVTAVCSDIVKESLHKTPRSLVHLEGEKLSIDEYEFLGGVNDNRLLFRSIAFGNGVYSPKTVDTMTYEYGEWQEQNTIFTLHVTPSNAPAYTLLYKGNAFVTPEGLVIGGVGLDNTARVEKWETILNTFPNTNWEAKFEDEFVMDSIFRDSIRATFIPPMSFKYDTLKIFTGKMDTLSADTTCTYRIEFNQDPATLATTGHFYQEGVRSTYDRETKQTTIVNKTSNEFDFIWFFTEVSTDAKFSIQIKNVAGGDAESLSISKYKNNESVAEFVLNDLTFKPYVLVP